MAKDTPSIAKNKIKRSLVALYDPMPNKKQLDELWSFFSSRCVYCNIDIERASRTGHLDHMLASSEGGGNNIHNFALSCATCNGDEKREKSWDAFLESKAPSREIYSTNKKIIEQWLSLAEPAVLTPEQSDKAQEIIEAALKSFDESVKQMRSLRDNVSHSATHIRPHCMKCP